VEQDQIPAAQCRGPNTGKLDQAISLVFSKITDKDEGWSDDASVAKDDTEHHFFGF
jgi:hypothetical protein